RADLAAPHLPEAMVRDTVNRLAKNHLLRESPALRQSPPRGRRTNRRRRLGCVAPVVASYLAPTPQMGASAIEKCLQACTADGDCAGAIDFCNACDKELRICFNPR